MNPELARVMSKARPSAVPYYDISRGDVLFWIPKLAGYQFCRGSEPVLCKTKDEALAEAGQARNRARAILAPQPAEGEEG